MNYGKPVVDGLVVDTNTKLTSALAKALYVAGVRSCGRYVPLPGNSAKDDVDAAELALMGQEGLACFVIQHPRAPENNTLDAATGAADSAHAIAYCKEIGYVAQDIGGALSIVLDMEGVKNPGPDSFAHAKTWVLAVLAAGYRVVVYIGYQSGLSSAQLDELTALGEQGMVEFWCDSANYKERPVPSIGYALHQGPQTTVAGVRVDMDGIVRGGVVVALAFEPDPPASDPLPANPVQTDMRPIPVPSSAVTCTQPPPPPDPDPTNS